MPLADVAADVGGFDLVVEATGDAQVMLGTVALLGRNGVACLLGIDGRPRDVTVDGRVLGVDAILQNRALFGSVNAHREDWVTAVAALARARAAVARRARGVRRPDASASTRFAEAFAHRGVKATLAFDTSD